MKLIINVFLLVLIVTGFSQCSSAQKLQTEAPVKIGNAYYQHWVAGIQGGGSGINLFITVAGIINKSIQLDSVYFKGKVSKLEFKPSNSSLFIGRFPSDVNSKKDIIMSNKPKGEYGNETPIRKVKIPFELKENECVISYLERGKTKYFKIKNVVKKQPEYLPEVAPKKQ